MTKSTKIKTAAKKPATKAATKTKAPVSSKNAKAVSKNVKAVQKAAKKPVATKKPAIVKKAEVKKTATTKVSAVSKKAAPAPAKAVKPAAPAIKATVKGQTAVKVEPKKVAAPQQPVSKLPVGTPKAAAPKALAPMAPIVEKKPEKLDFAAGDFVVYPAHGVGYVEGVETQTIAGMEITLYTISFEKDRMRLKLPVSKVKASGLRKLSSKDRLKDALATLQGRSQTRRVMWSRRAQEYEAKINSGDPVAIAEVLRDLKKADDQSEQSYSERQIYQAALERLAREVAAIEKIDEKKAAEKLEAVLGNVA